MLCVACLHLDEKVLLTLPVSTLTSSFKVFVSTSASHLLVTRGQTHPSLARMPYGPTCFLLASIVVAMLSVFTFSRRKSYLQK
jgi:hypothetical protein